MQPLKMHEAFGWVLFSIIWICGSAFFSLVGYKTYHWYCEHRTLGRIKAVACESIDEMKVPKGYWEQLFAALNLFCNEVSPHRLEGLKCALMDTGYFRSIDLNWISRGNLLIRYKLNRALARLANHELYLYESGALLPGFPLPANSQLPELIIDTKVYRHTSLSSLQAACVRASCLLAQLKALRPDIEVIKVDLWDWDEAHTAVSDIRVLAQNESGCKLWLRLGLWCMAKDSFWKDLRWHNLLALSFKQHARWVDLRLENLAIIGY